jgi:hypothetical protein
MPKDIEPEILEEDSGKGEGSPKADNPSSSVPTESIPEVVKPPSQTVNEEIPGTGKQNSPKAVSP